MSNHLVNHFKNSGLKSDNTLHVVGVISNPARWHSRLRLFREWRDRMLKTKNVKLYVVEGVYGDHHPECAPEPGQEYAYMTVKLGSEIWLKENMINIAVNRLVTPACPDWKYLCWEDCDVEHENSDWALATIRALQTRNVIQTWSHGVAMDPYNGVLGCDTSFGFLKATGQKMSWGRHRHKDGYHYAHSGYSWACTRYFWENIGRLIDFCLMGSADHHMAWCMVGQAEDTIHGSMSKGYFEACRAWQAKAQRACGGQVGFAHGMLKHYFHGPARGRGYTTRWSVLVDSNYDPMVDIAYDGQGVLYLIGPNKHQIESGMFAYNRQRIEDSIEAI